MKRPNIVLINCDDLGYGDLACYGSRVNKTPCLDALAAGGTRYTDFYMASPVCSPSRGAMMTGCYPPRIGFGAFDGRLVLFPGQGCGLSAREESIALLLQRGGYATKIVGKWHCGDQKAFLPTRHGFDEYYGLPYSNDMGRQAGNRANYPPLPLLCGEDVIEQQPDQSGLTERYVEQSVAFIRKNRRRPFFLYLAHMHVHLPLYHAQAFANAGNGEYGGCVAAIDWATACVMRALREDGLESDTLVIFTSDNGSRGDRGGSNLPLRGAKGTTWEGGQRVPCIMYWPGRVPAGRVCREIVASIDLLPSLAALCGADLPHNPIDGVDLSPLFAGRDGASGRASFFFFHGNDLEAVRCGAWKLHVRKKGEPELKPRLYNLHSDIGEASDVSAAHPDVVTRLQDLLSACRAELGDAACGVTGSGVRPIGRVDDPTPLTHFDPTHPYIMAMYDKDDVG